MSDQFVCKIEQMVNKMSKQTDDKIAERGNRITNQERSRMVEEQTDKVSEQQNDEVPELVNVKNNKSGFIIRKIRINNVLITTIFAISGSIIINFVNGMLVGLSSVTSNQFNFPFVEKYEIEEYKSWIVGALALGIPIGTVPGCLSLENYNKRKIMGFAVLICILGCFFVSLVRSVIFVYSGRFLIGFHIGLFTPNACLYIFEMLRPHLRHITTSALCVSFSVGLLTSRVLAVHLNYKLTSYLCILILLAAFVRISSYSPDRPPWLLKRYQIAAEQIEFLQLRVRDFVSEEELGRLAQTWKTAVPPENDETYGLFQTIRSPSFSKPFFITMILFVAQQSSGFVVTLFYTAELIELLSTGQQSNIDDALRRFHPYAVVADVTRVIIFIPVSWLLQKFNRRNLLLFSSIGTSFSLLFLAILSEFRHHLSSAASVIVVTLLIVVHTAFSAVAMIPLPWLILSTEIYPVQIRRWGNTISLYFSLVFPFIMVKHFSFLFCDTNMSIVLYIAASITLASSLIGYFLILPENKKSRNVNLIPTENRD